jgi:uncharacterized membrane protein
MTMHFAFIAFLWLHIVAAAVWIGGMMFLALVLVPTIRRPEYRALGPALVHVTGVRFRVVGWIALAVLAASGAGNLWVRGIGFDLLTSAEFWSAPYGRLLALKLAGVASIVGVSLAHDLYVGPRATEEGRRNPGSEEALALRRRASLFGRTNLLLGLLLVAVGLMLARGVPW